MRPIVPGVYGVHLELDQGAYDYKFVLDGTTWILDPAQPRLR